MGGLLEVCENQSEFYHFEINNEMNRADYFNNEIKPQKVSNYPQRIVPNSSSTRTNYESAQAMHKLCQEITEMNNIFQPNKNDFSYLYNGINTERKKTVILLINRGKNEENQNNIQKSCKTQNYNDNNILKAKPPSSIPFNQLNDSFCSSMYILIIIILEILI